MANQIINFLIIVSFVCSLVTPIPKANADSLLGLPEPGMMVNLSPAYEPMLIKGLKVHPENPFLFDFIIDTGTDTRSLQKESEKLIKYFLAAMTVPERDLWVNLSPYEKNRMIASNLAQTEMGRDMLAQDYILKQMTASLIYPERNLGRIFWNEVYTKARQLYGTAEIPVNTFNKVWIIPDKADVYENAKTETVYVVGAHLKVMLEEDYLALHKKALVSPLVTPNDTHSIGTNIVREIILPELEKEVNRGKNFAPLRQMFYSMILASWYKMALKKALLTQIYGDQSKVKVGINQADPKINQEIFNRYLRAYKKGVFNYIKGDIDKVSQQPVPRKYFSGGTNFAMLAESGGVLRRISDPVQIPQGDSLKASGNLWDEVIALAPAQAAEKIPNAAMAQKMSISMVPDGDSIKVTMLIPDVAVLDPEISGLIKEISDRTYDFAMTNDGKGHRRLKFIINDQLEKMKSSLDFISWEKYAIKMLGSGIFLFTPTVLYFEGPKSIVEVISADLVAFILLLSLKEHLDKRFMSDHDYYIKVLKSFYEKGSFSNGHSSREVMDFYRNYYKDFQMHLDDNQEGETLELIAGTLSQEEREALRSKQKQEKFDQRLLWALDNRDNKKFEFLKIHQTYLKSLDPEARDKNKPLTKGLIVKALQFYNRNDAGFIYFLTKEEQEKTAELLTKNLPNAQKQLILSLGLLGQPTAIQKLMYWDLEQEAAEAEKDKVPEPPKEAPSDQAMIVQSRVENGGIDLNSGELQMGIQKNGLGIEMRFDPASIDRIKANGFDGLEFNIRSLIPVTNLPALLGVRDWS